MLAKFFKSSLRKEKAGTFAPAKKRNLEMYRFTTVFL